MVNENFSASYVGKRHFGSDDFRYSAASQSRRQMLARFRELYESRDGKLCLFETKEGHLAAVDTSRFAG